jgi:hypothetical protein
MGQLRNQLFLQHINETLASVRVEFQNKYTAKKNGRFLIKGLTYEIDPCVIEEDEFVIAISSKIPDNLLFYRSIKEKYYNKVVALLAKEPKKPGQSKIANVVRNTVEDELKERDYVIITYRYKENEFYTIEDVDKRLKKHREKGIPIPDVPGVATPGGKLVILILVEEIAKAVRENVLALVRANDSLAKEFDTEKSATTKKPAAKKKK